MLNRQVWRPRGRTGEGTEGRQDRFGSPQGWQGRGGNPQGRQGRGGIPQGGYIFQHYY
jgi:hypothetical protein